MATFTVPRLPGENLLTITAVARRAGCSRQAIYDAIGAGKIGAALSRQGVVI